MMLFASKLHLYSEEVLSLPSTLRTTGRAPSVLCRSVTTVLGVDVLSHFLAVGHRVATLHTGVAPFGVLPEDASAAGHT